MSSENISKNERKELYEDIKGTGSISAIIYTIVLFILMAISSNLLNF